MFKSILSYFRETKEHSELTNKAWELFRSQQYHHCLSVIESALTLSKAFSPRTEELLYLKAACFCGVNETEKGAEIWSELVAKNRSSIPEQSLYPLLRTCLAQSANNLFRLYKAPAPKSYEYFLRIVQDNAETIRIISNYTLHKDSFTFITTLIAEISFTVLQVKYLRVELYSEERAEGGETQTLILKAQYCRTTPDTILLEKIEKFF